MNLQEFALIALALLLAAIAYTAATFTIGRTADHTLRLITGVGISLTALSFLALFDLTDPLTIALTFLLMAQGAGIRTLREAYDTRQRQYTVAQRQRVEAIKRELQELRDG